MNANLTTVLIPLLLGGIFVVLGLALLLFGQRQRSQAKAAEKWPTANGAIVSSQIAKQSRIESNQDSTYTSTTHKPVVEYTYDIGGKTYRGNRVFPGPALSYDLMTAQGIIDRYPAGQTVTVHYNPADPAQAVLENKAKGGIVLFIVGAVFVAIGFAACCIGGALALLGRS